LSCADKPRVLGFSISNIPKAKTTEVEITHSIKNTELELYNLWE
jgi:hypothetical protein